MEGKLAVYKYYDMHNSGLALRKIAEVLEHV